MKKRYNNKQIVFKVLATLGLLLCVVFIFYNSSRIGVVSGNTSKQVVQFVNSLLGNLGINAQIGERLVRKLGHVAEFMLLGVMMMLTLRVYTKRLLAFIAWPFFVGLLIAVCDEFLQLFVPGRSSEVADVLIDFAGLSAGIIISFIAIHIVGKLLFPAKRVE